MRRAPVVLVLFALLLGVSGFLGVRASRAPRELVVADPPLRFTLPVGWHRYERDNDPDAGWIREAAARQGFTVQDFVAGINASTLATAVGPTSGGRYQTVDVQRSDFSGLPTSEQARNRLTRLAVDVDGVHTVSTRAGEVVVAQGHFPVAEGRTETETIHLVTHGKALMITISAVGGGDVEPVTQGILATLRTS